MRLGSASRRQPRAAFRYLAEDAPSEYGDVADRLVGALRAAGVRLEYSGDPRPTERAPRRAPTVAHVAPERLPDVRAAIVGGPLIAHTTWETDRLPRHWAKILEEVDCVIVPTEWARDVFLASGVTAPVRVVPSVVCDPVPGDAGLPLELGADLIVFYVLDRWDQRAAPADAIRAFLEAFTADDRVALVVKTTPRAGFTAPEPWGVASDARGTTMLEVARIIRKYPHPPIVRLEVDDWAPERFAGLHSRGDCYLSLAHGERWGLGALDAAAYGNPVVTSGWGGPLASLGAEPGCLVEYDLEPVPLSEADPYGPEPRWAVPRLEHAVELLRRVAVDLGAARARAAPLRERVLQDRAPARVAAMLLDAIPELSVRAHTTPPAPAPARRGRSETDELLLVGLTVGVWRTAFDNWVEMAERHRYPYELVGLEAGEPYVPHATKLQLLRDYFETLPRAQLVFYLDATDAFVCAAPAAVLARFRSYGHSLVLGAEHRSTEHPGGETAEQRWRFGNAGGYVGEAGVIADALRHGFELDDWEGYGLVSDQRAMLLYLDLPENRHRATLDHRRLLVQNLAAAVHYQEFDEHRVVLNGRPDHTVTSSVHFYGDNGRGYNLFARLYALTPHELEESGRFRVPLTNPGTGRRART